MSGQVFRGAGVSPGVAAGRALVLQAPAGVDSAEPPTTDLDQALGKVLQAANGLARELHGLAEANPAAQAMLTAQAMMAKDPDLMNAIKSNLAKGMGLTAAVQAAANHYESQLAMLGGYMAERVTDLRDVRDRLISHLRGQPSPVISPTNEPFVLVAQDLAPSQVVGLDKMPCLAIATAQGGPTSHSAILAAQMAIPAVVGAGGLVVDADITVAVDGAAGLVVVAPSQAELAQLHRRKARRDALAKGVTGPGVTADGVPIALLANLGRPNQLQACIEAGAEGVGLFRSEFLYLDRTTAPSLADQRAIYHQVLQRFTGKRVIIRTLDAGADKPLAFADLGHEDNPALGQRGLRLSMLRPELLQTQLAAIAAAAEGTRADLWVMAPMVSTVEESQWFAGQARAAGLPRVGAMIEVPAAALRTQSLLASLDFASLGTNDLAQYTMAADRLQSGLAGLLDPWQPAVLDLVNQACQGANAASKPIGVCGEAAGDPLLALVLIGLGVGSLSMAPAKIAAVRASLARHTMDQCRQLATLARSSDTAAQARQAALAAADPLVAEAVLGE
ncbi:MAG: phosphoenolpyruvate--protein phosphotransferase [Micrococcales bacterium]|nr:phosphoenolpyruvate--protein phosphotransferase [Micrococcales bacterium]